MAEVQLLAEGCEPIWNRTVVEWVVLEVIVSELLSRATGKVTMLIHHVGTLFILVDTALAVCSSRGEEGSAIKRTMTVNGVYDSVGRSGLEGLFVGFLQGGDRAELVITVTFGVDCIVGALMVVAIATHVVQTVDDIRKDHTGMSAAPAAAHGGVGIGVKGVTLPGFDRVVLKRGREENRRSRRAGALVLEGLEPVVVFKVHGGDWVALVRVVAFEALLNHAHAIALWESVPVPVLAGVGHCLFFFFSVLVQDRQSEGQVHERE